MRVRWILVALLLCSGAKAAASWQLLGATPFQRTTQSHARAVVLTREGRVALGLDVRLDPGWHTYWANPGDSGAAPQIGFTAAVNDPPPLGTVLHPIPLRTAYGPVVSYLHEGELVLMRELADGPSRPSGKDVLPWVTKTWSTMDTEYLVCTAEECLPAVLQIELMGLERAADLSPDDRKLPIAEERYPKPLLEGEGQQLTLEWRSGPGGAGVRAQMQGAESVALKDLFERSGQGASTRQPTPQSDGSLWIEAAEFLLLQRQGKREILPWSGLVQVDLGGQTVTYEFFDVPVHGVNEDRTLPMDAEPYPSEGASFLLMVVFAALGGLILNIMPCVFPVLSLKAMSLLRAGQSAAAVRTRWVNPPKPEDLSYLAGVMASILTLGLGILVVRSTGYALGWGSQLQSPVFNHLLVLLFLFLALGFWGASPRLVAAGMPLPGLPSRAQKSPLLKEFFTGVLAVVVASPCTAPFMASALGFALLVDSSVQSLAIFAALGLGFAAPLFALAVFPPLARLFPRPGPWLGSFERFLGFPLVLTSVWLMWVSARQITDYAWHVALTWLVMFSMGLWLWRASGRVLSRICAALLVVAACAGLVAMARIDSAEQRPNVAQNQASNAQRGIVFSPWDPLRIDVLRRQQVPVFVDFTARWCVTCQVNKKVVFEREDVGIDMARLGYQSFAADWTTYDPAITQALARFGRAGVPLYVLYPADPKQPPRVLDQILTPEGFLAAARDAAVPP